jgi:hypothetical protein
MLRLSPVTELISYERAWRIAVNNREAARADPRLEESDKTDDRKGRRANASGRRLV